MNTDEIADIRLRTQYRRALHDVHFGFVNPQEHPFLDRALTHYAVTHHCTYDEALIFAKTGRKVGHLA